MTQVELSESVVDALEEIARLRGLDGPEAALEEAIGIERQVALSASVGAQLLVTPDGGEDQRMVQIKLPKSA